MISLQAVSLLCQDGGTSAFTYDGMDNLLRLTDARGGVTQYSYDGKNRAVTRTDPVSKTERFQYDGNDNQTQSTDRKGQVTNTTYDSLNRRTQVTYADGSTTTSTYDAGDRLTQIVDTLSGTLTRSYDGLDRLTSEGTPQGTVSYSYDAAGRRTAMTATGQSPVAYVYDTANRLTQLTQGTARVSFTYDAANRRTSLTLPNGIRVDSSYDTASRLTGLTYKKGATVLGTLTYSYDRAGRRSKTGGSYGRTGLPQPLSSASYNAANRMLTFGVETLSYDFNGNLVSDGTDTFTWDARNRLTSLSGPGLTASFVYDPLGRRVRKTLNGVTREWLYDSLTPLQELAGATITASQLTGLGMDEYFSRTEGTVTRSLLPDALGSTVAVTNATGTVQTQYTYAPFGETTVSGAASTNPFQFTGRENDGTTDLYYYRARYYHPVLQRFISEDPIGFAGGDTNLYAYVGNDPVNWVDPSGLSKFPSDPSQVPRGWTPDPSHRDPNGQRFRDPNGRPYDFHPGRPGKPGWRGKDHWHCPPDETHYRPGEEIPGSEPDPGPQTPPDPPKQFSLPPVPWWLPLLPFLTPWPDPY